MGNFAPNAEVMTQSGFISPMGDPFMGFDFGPFQGDGSGIANVSITLDPTGVNGFGYGKHHTTDLSLFLYTSLCFQKENYDLS